MDMLALIAAFGGGAFGALIGALPAFILTGAVVIAGAAVSLAGGADVIVGNVAFGSFLGPHIAFAGGVAATAFAANIRSKSVGKVTSTGDVEGYAVTDGAGIGVPMNITNDYSVLLVGGLFGILGFLINYLYANVLGFATDTVAMTVATSGIIARLVFGKTGLLGKGPKPFFTTGNGFIYNVVMGLSVSIVVSYVGAYLMKSVGVEAAAMSVFPPLCFGISALSLVFTQTGSAVPGTHHITLIGALATVASGNPLVGVGFGLASTLIGDFAANTFNTNCDSHIDPPAVAIFICTFIINAMF